MRGCNAFVASLAIILTTSVGLVWADTLGEAGTIDTSRLERIDEVVAEAMRRGDMPGAVVFVVHRGATVFHKAYGLRAKEPAEIAMTEDTVFDLASLTKPIATATSVMRLLEQGRLRLSDPVSTHLPDFAPNGKDQITIEHLLLHTSGLIADNPVKDYEQGRDKAIANINNLTPLAEPGARFIYSDVNYIVLGLMVERLSGKPLDEFAAENIYRPLGMTDTGFKPDRRLHARLAPTEKKSDKWEPGAVHDPRSYLMGGVAGHAGLFSTASDLAKYARMLLDGGSLDGKRVLAHATVRLMTTPRPVPTGLRALGWDARTSFSTNRGELFSPTESFGHTGFTGTSIWLDPSSQTAVIFLSNRVHPHGKGNVTQVRGQVATIVASALAAPPTKSSPTVLAGNPQPTPRPARSVLTGVDVLREDGFKLLAGKRVALVTNHSGLSRTGESTIDLLHKAEGVKLVALFSPEHGIRGAVDEKVADSTDQKTGLPVFSLYGEKRKPSSAQLQGVDALVFDIQDAGCRFYTYISTLGNVLEAAAENKVKVVVLDRPNPIGGLAVQGPILDAGRESFVAYHRIPVRHGMTVGELALLFNGERRIGADLEVVRMKNWRRSDFFDATGLSWVNPSPNLRSLTEALLYPGVGLLETTNLSVGRGTDRPFEWIGAPWMDGQKLAAGLAEHRLPGLRFVPTKLTPSGSVHKGALCGGVGIFADDWSRVDPLLLGMTLAYELRRLFPDHWKMDRYDVLLGNKTTIDALKKGTKPKDILLLWEPGLAKFKETRAKHLLYAE